MRFPERSSARRRELGPAGGSLLAGLACATVASVAAADEGVLGAVLGTLLVVGFFVSGRVPLLLAHHGGLQVRAGVGLLLLTYTLRLAVALMVLAVAGQSEAISRRWLGISIIVSALAWSSLQLVSLLRASPPIDSSHGAGTSSSVDLGAPAAE